MGWGGGVDRLDPRVRTSAVGSLNQRLRSDSVLCSGDAISAQLYFKRFFLLTLFYFSNKYYCKVLFYLMYEYAPIHVYF